MLIKVITDSVEKFNIGEDLIEVFDFEPDASADMPTFTVDGYNPAEEIFYETLPGKKTTLKLYEDEYYILNDYRSSKTDSRSFGSVSKSDIKGNLIFILRRRDF